MVEAGKILNTSVETPPVERPPARQPRKLAEIIPSQLEALRNYHLAVLDTESVEAIHKMRVTTRRLQASLDLLEREMKVRKLKRRLRRWRRRLSSVRNYDVFLELIEKEAASRGRTRREQLELVKSILHDRRFHRAEKVKNFLQDIKIHSIAFGLGISNSVADELAVPAPMIEDSSVGINSPGPDETAAPAHDTGDTSGEAPTLESTTATMDIDERRVASYAAERLEQRLDEFQVLAAQSHPTNDPAELHQLRIAAKRVRYLLEIVTAMGFGDASRALAWLRSLQDRIGDWHDLEALEEEIVAIVSSPEFMKQHLAASSQMLQAAAHLQKKKEALVARLFPVRVPRYLDVTSHRIARALRRQAIQRPVSSNISG
jgi:CHAD domain-containing protein